MATARPVNELSSEITTGISAPPIGSTNMTPSTSASATITPYAHVGWMPSVIMTHAASPAIANATIPLTNCCPRYVTGRPVMSSCNFRKAITEPAALTAPMIALMTSDTSVSTSS